GAGSSARDLAVVMEELGRGVVCAPFLSTVCMAVPVVLASGDDSVAADLLPAVANGERTATVAWIDVGPGTVAASTDDPAEFLLTGTKSYVIDGHTASVLLVLADGPAGPTLFVVDGDGSGVERTRLSTMDQTRKQASVRFDGACGRVVGEPGGGAQ